MATGPDNDRVALPMGSRDERRRPMKRCLAAARYALAALAFASLGANAQEKVILAMPTVVGAQYSDIAFGMDLGFFKEEGIDLQLVAFQGSGVAVPQVVNKAVTFGLTESSLVITALAKNEPLPVRFFYNYLRENVNNFAVLADGPVKTLADLKGRKLGVGSLTFNSVPMTKAAFKELGLVWGKDVEIRPVGVGAAAWKQLESGQVEALNLYLSENVRMGQAGLKIRQIAYPDPLRRLFASALMTHVDTIRDKPQLVAAMGRAWAKSTIACASAREACARAYWKYAPTARPAPDKEAEWIANTTTVLSAQYSAISRFTGTDRRWGSFAPDTLDAYIQALKDADLIARTDLNREQIFTNRFIDDINRFDAAAVVARAREAENTVRRPGQ
jgi:NitT/TauT family transport system substrate-binding protein